MRQFERVALLLFPEDESRHDQRRRPRTEEGKAASSRNALRHGLTSAQVILPGENPAELESLRDSLFEAHQPAPGLETVLLDQVVQCLWRLNRARRIELEALEADLTAPDDAAPAGLDKILRYTAAIERELHRALHDFNAMQATRAKTGVAAQKSELVARKQAAKDQTAKLEKAICDYIYAPMPGMNPEIAKRTHAQALAAGAGRR